MLMLIYNKELAQFPISPRLYFLQYSRTVQVTSQFTTNGNRNSRNRYSSGPVRKMRFILKKLLKFHSIKKMTWILKVSMTIEACSVRKCVPSIHAAPIIKAVTVSRTSRGRETMITRESTGKLNTGNKVQRTLSTMLSMLRMKMGLNGSAKYKQS